MSSKAPLFRGGLRDCETGAPSLAFRRACGTLPWATFGDTRSVGDEVSEMRIHYGPGYQLYFTRQGANVVILLCGGDKDSQQRDIALAKRIAAQLG